VVGLVDEDVLALQQARQAHAPLEQHPQGVGLVALAVDDRAGVVRPALAALGEPGQLLVVEVLEQEQPCAGRPG
jgi:hypothetical protein